MDNSRIGDRGYIVYFLHKKKITKFFGDYEYIPGKKAGEEKRMK